MKTSGRPLVLTQRGHSAAVLLDVVAYERMVEELELLTVVRTSLAQIEAGQRISNRQVKAELCKRFAPRDLPRGKSRVSILAVRAAAQEFDDSDLR